jgi:L-alanine-DL-glutamate epimerase-like enolase superfamily enzyme
LTEGRQIKELGLSAYSIPTEVPEADGTLAWDHTTVVVVEPRLEDGTTGLGYAFGHPGMIQLISETLAPKLVGLDINQTGKAWREMVRSIRNLGRPGLCSMAIAAVDIALWDTKARCLSQPLHRLLGATREAVPVYGSGGFTTYTETQLLVQMTEWVAQGIPRVKMKIGTDRGRSWKQDLDRIAKVRQAIGPDVELFVDANGAYSEKQAEQLGRRFREEFNVAWFEEPVSSDDLGGLHRLRDRLALEVTAGEYGYHLEYFGAMLEAGAVDVLQADVGRCAGITEWLRVAALAAAHKVDFSAHCGPSLHAAVATVPPNLRHIEYFHDHVRTDHLLFDGVLEPKDGALWPSERPGLGLEIRRSDAARYRVG